MSIFNQIINAIDSPEREASSDQLSNILDTVQQLSGNNQTNPDTIQTAMSIVGNFTKSALQQQRDQGGMAQVNQLINQFGGTQASPQILATLFGNSQIENMIQQISNRTGLNTSAIQSMLPILVPLILNMLKTGNNRQNLQDTNPVVSSFLDSDGDGDMDLTDALNMASRYLGR